jgi:hypothetical protein
MSDPGRISIEEMTIAIAESYLEGDTLTHTEDNLVTALQWALAELERLTKIIAEAPHDHMCHGYGDNSPYAYGPHPTCNCWKE